MHMFSMVGMIMAVVALYMLLDNAQCVALYLLSAISFGIGVSMILLGGSRLSVLVIISCIVAFIFFSLKKRIAENTQKSKLKQLIKADGVVLALIVAILVGNMMPAVQARSAHEDTQIEQQESGGEESNQEEEEAADSIEPTELPEAETEGLRRFNFFGMDLNQYTAGRFGIWKNYSQFFNLTGNNIEEADWGVLTGNTVKHAHNNFVEMAYRCGVPVAILHTLINLVAILICFVVLFDKKYLKPYYLFCVMFVLMYTVEGLFDIATIPFERHAPFMFYIALIPLISLGKQKQEKQQNIKSELQI